MNITGNRFSAGSAWVFALCLACLMLLSGISLQAQTVYGSMAGTITDPSGGVIPGASITIINLGTAEKRTVASDAAGSYRFVNLVPGRYQVDVEKTGFKHFTRDNILVEVEAALRIDVPMQVGQVTEVVEVSSAAPLLQTEGGTLSQVVESRTVTEMPLNGRNVMNLIALTPGVIAQGSSSGSALGNQHGATYSNPAGWGNYQIWRRSGRPKRSVPGWRIVERQLEQWNRVDADPGCNSRVPCFDQQRQSGIRPFRRRRCQHGHQIGDKRISRDGL